MSNLDHDENRQPTVSQKVVLVTGASRGIGLETAKLLGACTDCYKVYGTWNQTHITSSELPNVTLLQMDQTCESSIRETIAKIQQRSGRVDVLVNNAGMGVYGPVELLSAEAIRKQFDVNLTGPLLLMKEVLPLMRQHGYGRLLNVTSLAGVVGIPLMDVYCASKFGLEGACAAMEGYISHMEDDADIRCQVIEPGFTSTEFKQSVLEPEHIPELFSNLWQRFNQAVEGNLSAGQSPVEVAEVIKTAIEDTSDTYPFRIQPNKERTRHYHDIQGFDMDGSSLVLRKMLEEIYPDS